MTDSGGFRAHRDPTKGNFVSHELLFGTLPEDIRDRTDIFTSDDSGESLLRNISLGSMN